MSYNEKIIKEKKWNLLTNSKHCYSLWRISTRRICLRSQECSRRLVLMDQNNRGLFILILTLSPIFITPNFLYDHRKLWVIYFGRLFIFAALTLRAICCDRLRLVGEVQTIAGWHTHGQRVRLLRHMRAARNVSFTHRHHSPSINAID